MYNGPQASYNMPPGPLGPPAPQYPSSWSQQQPQTIVISHKPQATITNLSVMGDQTYCAACEQNTPNVIRHKTGSITFLWCCCLFWTTGGLLACLPFCCDNGCKDAQFVCQKCVNIKTTIPATCC